MLRSIRFLLFWCARGESNPRFQVRSLAVYPLSYGRNESIIAHSFLKIQNFLANTNQSGEKAINRLPNHFKEICFCHIICRDQIDGSLINSLIRNVHGG